MKRKSDRAELQEIALIGRVLDLCAGDEELMFEWLERPVPASGAKPRQLLRSPEGRQRLAELLDRLVAA